MYEELIKRLREEIRPDEFDNQWDLTFACQNVMAEAADAIENLSDIARATATIIENEKDMRVIVKASRWIPVTEKLPSENDRYLTVSIEPWFGTTIVDIMRWSGVWMYDGRQTDATVTHWMPLPTSPEEE